MHQLRLLPMLYYRPIYAIGRIIDEGGFLVGVVLTLAVSAAMVPPERGHMAVLAPLACLALCIVPGGILLAVAFESAGGFDTVLRRDYGAFLACVTMSWAAANLPVLILKYVVALNLAVYFISGQTLFAFYLVLIFRTLYGVSWGKAVVMTVLSPLFVVAGVFLWGVLGHFVGFLASPFILYFLWMSLRGDISDITSGFRTRQNYKRMMEAATANPLDSDAHYELGLIYQQRRQYTEAISRFVRAAEIDKMHADARFQLGRIAREQGRLDDAVAYLQAALEMDDKVCASEGWRELGATHFAAGRYDAALTALQKFVQRREYEPEGLYWLGETLLKLNREAEAKECFERCVESVKTMPSYRRGATRKWGSLAGKRL